MKGKAMPNLTDKNKPIPHRFPGHKLTVVIRDDSPLVHFGDPVRYRSVQLDLPEHMTDALKLKYKYTTNGIDYYEEISQCFIEPKYEEPE